MNREFVYFKAFDKYWQSMGLTDDDVIELENTIMENPSVGRLIQGTGGVRKMRFILPNNKGKSGGARVLYVDYVSHETTVMLNVYPKGQKETITDAEKNELKKIVSGLSKELKK